MNGLRNIQQLFQSHVLKNSLTILENIAPPHQDSLTERLRIYSDGYYYRLLEALEKDYQVLNKKLGRDFYRLGKDYISAHPSRNYSVGVFTQGLVNFIKTYPRYHTKPYIYELACFSLAINQAVTSLDAPLLTLEMLNTIPFEAWETVCFKFHPSIVTKTYLWNVVVVSGQPHLKFAKLTKGPKHYLIGRKDLQTFYVEISLPQLIILQALQQGQTFGESCEQAACYLPESQVISVAAQIFQWACQQGVFSEVIQ